MTMRTTAATAGTALEAQYGSPAALLLPEINGMGGTGAALYRGGVSNVINPAFLSAEQGWRLDAAVAVEEAHEDRFVPLFDTFVSYVTDTAIASNRHHFFGTGFGFAHHVGRAHLPLTVALSLTDRYAFGYDFDEEIRDPDPFADPRDKILEERAIEVDGTLRALSAGVAWEFTPNWSLGAAVHYAFGSRDETRRRLIYDDLQTSTSEKMNVDLDGANITLGTRFVLNERLEFGAAYESPLLVTGELATTTAAGVDPVTFTEESGHLSIHYPRNWRAGFTYLPRTEPRTVFTADAVFTEWTHLMDSRTPGDDNPMLLEDTWDIGVGVQHTFYSGFVARFGFRHIDSYADREAGTSLFSGGVGFPVAGGLVSASTELSKISSVQPHWFPYPAGYVAASESRVEDTRFRFALGFTRDF
jgi:hypothetical protein